MKQSGSDEGGKIKPERFWKKRRRRGGGGGGGAQGAGIEIGGRGGRRGGGEIRGTTTCTATAVEDGGDGLILIPDCRRETGTGGEGGGAERRIIRPLDGAVPLKKRRARILSEQQLVEERVGPDVLRIGRDIVWN